MLPGGLTEDDYTILQFIAERHLVTTPKTVAANLDIGYDRVRNRMHVLLEEGFLKRPSYVPEGVSEQGLFEASELGHRVADEDLTISELHELLSNRDEYTNN